MTTTATTAQLKQDLPPSGGFPQTIKYQRYIPKRGPSGLVLFTASLGIMSYGWYWVQQSNTERKELRREKIWARIHLVPLLQAELDRDHVRRLEAVRARESKAMDGVEGWKALDLKSPTPGVGKGGVYDPHASEPVYHTNRFVHPSYLGLDDDEETIPAQWWRGSKFFLKNPQYQKRADFNKETPLGGGVPADTPKA